MLGVEHLLPPAQLIMRKLAQGIRQRAPSDAKGAGSLVHGKRPHGPRGPCEVSLTDAGASGHFRHSQSLWLFLSNRPQCRHSHCPVIG
jgi:hypothetical protein